MKIILADWEFQVEAAETTAHSMKCSTDHCLCAYCRNYYETADAAHPSLRPFLERFGLVLEGPSEVMPLEPDYVMTGYRVLGQILNRGEAQLHVNNVPVHFEDADPTSFFLWAGPMELPWVQGEPMEDVISPANQPEFLERMARKWLEFNAEDTFLS